MPPANLNVEGIDFASHFCPSIAPHLVVVVASELNVDTSRQPSFWATRIELVTRVDCL